MSDEGGEGRIKYMRFLRVIFMVQFLLGIALIVCGALGVKYSERRKDSFEQSFNIAEEISYYSGDDFESSRHTETEPPYYIGAFPVGALVIITGVVSYIIYRAAETLDTNVQNQVKHFACLMCVEQGLCITTCLAAFVGFFISVISGISGLYYCDAFQSEHFCIYTENIVVHKCLAFLITLLSIGAFGISGLIICCSCKYVNQFGILFRQVYKPLVTSGINQRVSYHATNGSTVTEPGFQPGKTPSVDGDPTFTYLSDVTTQSENVPSTIQELREQNRLLQEQINLQQQQLQLRRRFTQQPDHGMSAATPMDTPLPPSYEESVSDEALIRQLQQYNFELQQQYRQQQQELDHQSPLEPSAPPK